MAINQLQDCYWWQATPLRSINRVSINRRCDVVIVGAGYTGLAAALHLARAGVVVQVIERNAAGYGGSTRNAGILSGNLKPSYLRMCKTFGVDTAKAIFREAQDARSDFKTFVESEKIDCDIDYSGRFLGAMTAVDFDAMRQEADIECAAVDSNIQPIPKSKQSDYCGSDLYQGGFYNPDIGTMHPGKFHRGLLNRVLGAGVCLSDQTEVQSVLRVKGGYRVKTSQGTIGCERVIMATNAYSDQGDPWLRRRIVPVISRIIVTQVLPPNIMAQLFPKCNAHSQARYLAHYYRPTPDFRRILIGGRETFWGSDPIGSTHRLLKNLYKIFPQLEKIKIDYTWSGRVAYTMDQVPSLFEHEGVLYPCGYCGSGTIWARWLGIRAGEMILSPDTLSSRLIRRPPKAIPFYAGKPWFLPGAMAYYGLKDLIKRR